MAYEIIISEKPSSANKIAYALSDGKAVKKSANRVPYYELERNGKKIIVVSAVGHLYTVAEKKKSFNFPTFDVEWRPTADVNKSAGFSRKYLNTIKSLCKKADTYTIATDYDIEGETIGYNILRYACKVKDANRMKYSTVTFEELRQSYDHKKPTIDWGQARAGETRHFLDWFYGINISRALMSAFKTTGEFAVLSSGRVQGPALKIIVDREKEIDEFKPDNYWQLELKAEKDDKKFSAWHEKDRFNNKDEAEKVLRKAKKGKAVVKKYSTEEKKQFAPHPFDLGTLQTEAYRCFSISPKETLKIAQDLYSSGYISYPRTSSQQLPFSIGFKKILTALTKQEKYKDLAKELLKKTKLVPRRGKKTDPAHPAIFPTGYVPESLDSKHQKIYSLIVHRFLTVFGDPAIRQRVIIDINSGGEIFIAKGSRTVEENWHKFYKPFLNIKEEELPFYKEGDVVNVEEIKKHKKQTQPPPRYTLSSIIKELERYGLGTKATRADIVDNLFKRGYVKGKTIQPTELGKKVVEALTKYSPEILDKELTRHFEEELELIREGKEKPDKVLEESKKEITKAIERFKKSKSKVGEVLAEAKAQALNAEVIGKCPVCKEGNLVIKTSRRFRKKFISCDAYPKCKTIFNIPQKVIVSPTGKICDICGYPIVKIKGREVCINPDCPGKKQEYDEAVKKLGERKCSKCGSKLTIRKSLMGLFIGCSNYPKCNYLESL